jgi:hypothetical protein
LLFFAVSIISLAFFIRRGGLVRSKHVQFVG